MPVGKPDFNLNSFGVKYLSKDEVQEFLEKRTQGEGIGAGEASRKMPETKFDNEATEQTEYISGRHSPRITSTSRRGINSKQVMNPRGQNVPKKVQGKGRNLTPHPARGKFEPSEAGKKQIENTLTNTPHDKPEPKAVDTKDTQFHYNESKPVSGEGMLREGASARGNRETPTHLGVTGEKTIPSAKPPKAATTSPNKGKKIAGQTDHVSTGKMVEDEDGVKRNTARAVFEETQGMGQEKKENIGEKGAGKKELNDMISRKADNDTTRAYNKKIKEITAGRKSKKGKAAYEALAASREKHGDDNHHEHHNTIFGKYHGQDEKKLEQKKESDIAEEKNRRAETNESMRIADSKAGVHTQEDSTRGDTEDDDTTGSDKVEIYSTGRKKDKEKPKHRRKLHGSYQGLKEGKQKEEDMITSGSYKPTAEDTAKDKKTTRAMRMYGKSNDIIMDTVILKLDLMKDLNTRDSSVTLPAIPKKESQHFQEQSTTARMGKLHDGGDYEDTPKTGSSPKGTGSSRQKLDTWQGGQEDSEYRKITNPEYTNDGRGMYDVQSAPTRKRGTPKVDPRMRKKDPIKTIPKTASETIFKAISLKLDLMKDALDGTGKNTTSEVDERYRDSEPQTKEGQASLERGMHARERDYNKRLYGGDYHYGRVPREHRDKPYAKPPVTKPYKGKKPDPRIAENKLSEKERTKIETTGLRDAGSTDRHIPRGDRGELKRVPDKERSSSGKGSPSDLREKAAEIIFKAISLKLDLMKVSSFKGSPKLPKVSNVKLNTSTNNWNDSKVDPDDYENGKPIDWAKRNAEQFQNDRDEEDANYYDSLEYDGRD